MKIQSLRNPLAALILALVATPGTLKAERWEPADPMITPRSNYSAVSLADGRVLVSGGGNASSHCEIFDPVTEKWSQTGSMITGRSFHNSVLLNDGKVLVLGGYYNMISSYYPSNTCEIYNPTTGQWSPSGKLIEPRARAATALLPNGKVLITGGANKSHPYNQIFDTKSCEIFDPVAHTSSISASMREEDWGHSLLVLNGKVIRPYYALFFSYDYLSDTWSQLASLDNVPTNVKSKPIVLNNDKLLHYLTWSNGSYTEKRLNIYNIGTNRWLNLSYNQGGPDSNKLLLLKNGKVLAGAESIYDPISNTWTSLSLKGSADDLLPMPDGRVLAISSSGYTVGIVGPDVPMTIAAQPVSLTVKQGEPAEFSVIARGVSLSYLWRRNGVNLGGQTRTLSLSNVQPADQGTYECMVYSAEGVLTSQPATLTVISTPAIATQPRSVLSSLGQLARFTVSLTPDSRPGVQYQWFKNGVEVPNSNSATLTLSSVKNTDVGAYHVVASNEAGSVTSDSVRLDLYSQELFQSAMAFGFDLGYESGIDSVVAGPNDFGLYDLEQVRTLHVGSPLLERDPASGGFTLRMQAERSTSLGGFEPMSFAEGELLLGPDGGLEYRFPAGDADAAFYRVRAGGKPPSPNGD